MKGALIELWVMFHVLFMLSVRYSSFNFLKIEKGLFKLNIEIL